jgi:D-aspartate ligase
VTTSDPNGNKPVRIADTSVPAVVLKAEEYGSLGIVRSLGRQGVRVYCVEGNPAAPATRSRYCAGKFDWNIDTAPAERSVDFLLQIAKKFSTPPVLIPTGDAANVFAAEHADALQPAFRFPVSPPGVAQTLYDKKEMYNLCKRFDVPTAETAFPQSGQDVLNFLRTAEFPVVLKAIDAARLQQRTGVRLLIVHDKAALLENYARMEDPDQPNLMLQEYIPGGEDSVWMFNGYFNANSECLFGATGRKLRQSPVYTGMTSLGICLKNETVAANTQKLMKAVGYRGILDIGHRYDARNGQYKILDINPRIGATFRLFAATNGLDVVRALYLDLTGQTVPAAEVRENRKWFVEDKDFFSCLAYRRDGKLTIGQWLASFRGVEEAAYFAWDDPIGLLQPASNIASRVIHRIARRTRPLKQNPAERLSPEHL